RHSHLLIDEEAVPTRRRTLPAFPAASEVDSLYRIDLPPTHENYMQSLSPKSRQNLRRTTRKLADGSDAKLVKVSAADQVPWFLDQLDSVFRNTWQAKKNGYVRRNSSADCQYFSEVASNGWLRSY